MKRFAAVTAVALAFGLLSATAAMAGNGNGDQAGNGPGLTQAGNGDGVCDGTGPSADCEQDGEQHQYGLGNSDEAPDGGQSGEAIRERDRDRLRACADSEAECTHDPAVDPIRERKQLRRQVWEHRGDGSGLDGEAERTAWMVQNQFRYCVPIAL